MPGDKPIWAPKAAKSKKYNANVWHLGADSGKDAWYARLKIKEAGPGYCHFPLDYDKHYFEMLTSEQVRTKYIKGRPIREWFLPANRRNEALDIRVLALAALLARPIDWTAIDRSRPIHSAPAPKATIRTGNSSFIRRQTGTPWIR